MTAFIGLVVRSVGLTSAAVLVGIVFNAVRSEGIPLVAPRPYEIYVPCPETLTEADSISAEETASRSGIVYVDARPTSEFASQHIKGAESFPYPLLGEPPQSRVDSLKNRGAPIVTYGDGGRGDLGEMLASLLTELGVPDVSHLDGGLAAWRAGGGEVEGEGGTEAGDEAGARDDADGGHGADAGNGAGQGPDGGQAR